MIYGGANLTNIDLANMTLTQGFSMSGAAAGDLSGNSVSGAGDVNKDGYADVIIGANFASPDGRNRAGTSYVIYGGANLTNIDLFALASSQGVSIIGASSNPLYSYGDTSGASVSAAGDVNKDGYADVIIGAPNASPSGRTFAGVSYVIYGGANLTNIDLANMTLTQGFSMSGAAAGDARGNSVSGAGDVNKDEYADIIIGGQLASPHGRHQAGQSHVIYGGANLTNIDLANITLTQGFSMSGAVANDHSGVSVATAGDVNKDGYMDVIIGAYAASFSEKYQAGQSYVVYGGKNLNNIDLANFSLMQGFSISGVAADDYSGYSASGAGDINKDGYDDVIIGAYQASSNGKTHAGASYVIYGQAIMPQVPTTTTTISTPIVTNILDLANLTLSEGFSIAGISGQSGWSAKNAGDVNNDGFADVIIGARTASPNGRIKAGQVYVVYGGTNPTNVDMANITTSQGFSITGASAGDLCGVSVNSAGDVNKDGYGDMIIGASFASLSGRSYAGTSYVIYGGLNLTNLDLTNLTMAQGFSIVGATAGGYSGTSVSGAGDVNNDGYADLIIGTPNYYASAYGNLPNSQSYVIYGGENITNLDLGDLPVSRGFSITGVANDWGGHSVSGAGDVNKDGYADLIIGAFHASPDGRYEAGQSYVIYGRANLTNIDLTDLPLSRGFSISGAIAGDNSGESVRKAGDINDDGFADVIIGAYNASPNGKSAAGVSYVIYGGVNLTSLDLANLTTTRGFSIAGTVVNGTSGYSVSGAGDINADGYDDVIIGAEYASPNGRANAGQSYVIYGGANLTNIDLSNLPASQGFFINGAIGDRSGASVSAAGDVNKDGIDDCIIGSPDALANGGTPAGVSYIIYGKPNGVAVTTTKPDFLQTTELKTTLSISSDGTTEATPSTFSSIPHIETSTPSGQTSGGTNTSSWTSTIIGVTVGVVAAIGTGYLAYYKWRTPRSRSVGSAAGSAALNAIGESQEGNNLERMHVNPVYAGAREMLDEQSVRDAWNAAYEQTVLQDQERTISSNGYEKPHIDTWDAGTYETSGRRFQAVQKVVSSTGYENPHINTWDTNAYDTSNRPQPVYHTAMGGDVYETPHVNTWEANNYDILEQSRQVYLKLQTDPLVSKQGDLDEYAEVQNQWGFGEEA